MEKNEVITNSEKREEEGRNRLINSCVLNSMEKEKVCFFSTGISSNTIIFTDIYKRKRIETCKI